MRFIEGSPDFAAEVRSENDYGDDAELEMAEKRADYFAAGTQVVWDVAADRPTTRTLDELEALVQSASPFCRKVDPAASATLMDELDRLLRAPVPPGTASPSQGSQGRVGVDGIGRADRPGPGRAAST